MIIIGDSYMNTIVIVIDLGSAGQCFPRSPHQIWLTNVCRRGWNISQGMIPQDCGSRWQHTTYVHHELCSIRYRYYDLRGSLRCHSLQGICRSLPVSLPVTSPWLSRKWKEKQDLLRSFKHDQSISSSALQSKWPYSWPYFIIICIPSRLLSGKLR